ncbi:terminase gpA endonuclease subunit [Allorhodopirellula heiligendammensis]|uniref:Phage terminase large subunit (GpA) n=1 Tax=Allorhodopirellula heiligendammensis TaxID=2714739 RepID=A0A5C6BWT3_9BACT|nr:terminase gpA endonuclease subunit [Allorhodopirellula heiligendammensis]TWU15971.1 Phage terminase large subunit (GpA) [Allorhodopirellula heiligendammensis]
MVTIAQTAFAEALRNGKSSPPRSFTQWVESELIIPDGPHAGERFRIERQPAIRLWLDAVDDPQWRSLVFTAVTQFGKSLFGYVSPMLYHACELGESLGFCVPFADMADDKWQADVKPPMVASPHLRKLLPTRGSGSSGGTVRNSIMLANGAMLKIFSAGADDAGKAGFTCPTIALTEAARFSSAGGASVEANPLRQVRGRQRSYRREKRREYIEGTLTLQHELPWTLRESSSRSEIVAPCPHCRSFIAPGREHLVGWRDAHSEIAAANAATWICPSCEKAISEAQRHKMLHDAILLHAGQTVDKRGRVRGPQPETTRLWYHAKPFVNCLLSASDIASEEWLAAQIPEDTSERNDAEKELHQFVWSKIYEPPREEGAIEISRDTITSRGIEVGRGQLPADVQLVATGYDLGNTTGWYLTLASRADGRLLIVDYGSFDIHSDKARPREAIRAALTAQLPYLNAGYPILGGGNLRAHQVWADAGHERKAIWDFTRDANEKQSLKQWIIACRGRGETQMQERKYTCPTKKAGAVRQIAHDRSWYVEFLKDPRCFEIHWDADRYKWLAQHGLTLPLDRPGAIALHAGPEKGHRTLARHCCNEQLVHEFVPGVGASQKWIRTGANHLLDCLAESYAALCRLGYRPPVAKLDEQPDADSPNSEGTPEPPRPAPVPPPLPDAQREKIRNWFAKQ